jgi:hypothetical protein
MVVVGGLGRQEQHNERNKWSNGSNNAGILEILSGGTCTVGNHAEIVFAVIVWKFAKNFLCFLSFD